MRNFLKWLICIVLLLAVSLPVSANSSTDDISQIIREAQAQAIRNLGGITANDADAVAKETERILREEYGFDADSPSVDKSYQSGTTYESGYELGYSDGYADGVRDGIREAERRAEAEKEEMANNRMGAYFSIFIVIMISVVVSIIDKRKYRRK